MHKDFYYLGQNGQDFKILDLYIWFKNKLTEEGRKEVENSAPVLLRTFFSWSENILYISIDQGLKILIKEFYSENGKLAIEPKNSIQEFSISVDKWLEEINKKYPLLLAIRSLDDKKSSNKDSDDTLLNEIAVELFPKLIEFLKAKKISTEEEKSKFVPWAIWEIYGYYVTTRKKQADSIKRDFINLIAFSTGIGDSYAENLNMRLYEQLIANFSVEEKQKIESELPSYFHLIYLLNDYKKFIKATGQDDFFARCDGLLDSSVYERLPAILESFINILKAYDTDIELMENICNLLTSKKNIRDFLEKNDPLAKDLLLKDKYWHLSVAATLYEKGCNKLFHGGFPEKSPYQKEAEKIFELSLQFPHPPLEVFTNFLYLYYILGEYAKGGKLAERVQPFAPKNPVIYHNTAIIYCKTGQFDKALIQVKLAHKYNYTSFAKLKTDKNLEPLLQYREFSELFENR